MDLLKIASLLLALACPQLCFAQSPAGTALSYGEQFSHHAKSFDKDRRYMVALPERYQAGERRYPVLYILDGDFHFRHVAAAVNNLARMGKIPPMIVVGVAMQGEADYLKSTTWASAAEGPEFGAAATMLKYLKDELVPTIDKQFRTNDRRALAGYSLGGLLVLQAMVEPGSPFNAFLAMSPSLWYDNYSFNQQLGSYMTAAQAPLPPLFLSVANEQGMGVAELKALIDAKGLANWYTDFKHYPNETHYSTAMPALLDGLAFLAPNYYSDLDTLLPLTDYRQVLNHFVAKQQQWAGFRFEWLQSYTLGKYLFISKQQDKVDELLSAFVERFPESELELTLGLVKAFLKKAQPQQAQALLQRVAKQGEHSADWHQQLSLALAAMGDKAKAEAQHARALALAKAQQLESWEWWELGPE
ncbi:alpha/beta hydrolase [Shewanella cyperi]|uniref:Alpha/beta hydrolase n=1 Tax=Shewanella cyperi TaxID=2814292 RepID=A0A974XJ79_9GAMM|nr:alpha/beta hydrolase-fold protein [Shewanella cyperi]QSX29376.1 alpha/beta hydrolase [Shewanella cyperi]